MASYAKLPPASFENIQVCSISFNMNDRIRLIAVPGEMTHAIRDAISLSWGKIQDEREYHGAHEFKLKGNPWLGHGDDSVYSRRLLAAILKTMAVNGWNLLQAADVSKKYNDKDTLFFEYGHPDPEAQMVAMSFNLRDRIRVIDAPELMPCVMEAVKSQWAWGTQNERDYNGAKEVKLRGNPWWPDGSETVYGRLLLCQIIANLKARGYKLYGSIDISVGTEGMDLESWIFRKTTPFYQ